MQCSRLSNEEICHQHTRDILLHATAVTSSDFVCLVNNRWLAKHQTAPDPELIIFGYVVFYAD